jgi:hypothetical protein
LATFAASRKPFFKKRITRRKTLLFRIQSSEISGDVSKIVYKQFVNDTLREFKLENFDVNRASRAFFCLRARKKSLSAAGFRRNERARIRMSAFTIRSPSTEEK